MIESSFLNKLTLSESLKFLQKIPTNSVDVCITDPPYNISGYDHKKEIGWLKSNKYWTETKKFEKINADWDKYSNSDYQNFMFAILAEISRVVKTNGNIAIFGTYHNIYKLGMIIENLDLKIQNSIIWYKRNAFPNLTQRMFCESTEQIIWAVNNSHKDAKNWTFNYDIMKEKNDGKQMRNMWDIPMTPSNQRKFGKHPSQKNELVTDRLILSLSNKEDIVLDPFIGSGTTAVSAKKFQRNFIGCDNNKEYLKIARKRVKATEYSLD